MSVVFRKSKLVRSSRLTSEVITTSLKEYLVGVAEKFFDSDDEEDDTSENDSDTDQDFSMLA